VNLRWALACSLVLLPALTPVLPAQTRPRARPGPNARYAASITNRADSVVLIAQAGNNVIALVASDGSDSSIAKMALLLLAAGTRMQTLAGDFDAVVPPEGFERLHTQLVDPLELAASSYFNAGASLAAYGESRPQEKIGMLQRAMANIRATLLATRDYSIARDRAQRMLSQRGVTLATYRGMASAETRPDSLSTVQKDSGGRSSPTQSRKAPEGQ
jgi:hypothetical protein